MGCAPPPPHEMTCGFLIQVVFCQKKKKRDENASPPPPKKNPGSAPGAIHRNVINLSNNFLFWQKMTIINFGTSHEKFRLES